VRRAAETSDVLRCGGVRQLNPSFQFDVDGVSDLQVLWEDGERALRRGWLADG
jgi:hypothetical protein